MRYLTLALAGAAAIALTGCETMRTLAPQTTAGYEANGILGALDGATGAILARCKLLDGQEVRIAVDSLAATAGQALTIDAIRVMRQRACAQIGAAAVVGDLLLAPPPAPPMVAPMPEPKPAN